MKSAPGRGRTRDLEEGSSAVGKVLWHTLMSLDGFVAGPDDDMGWALGVDIVPGGTVDRIVASTGALLVGRRTQDVEDRLQPGFYGGAFRGPFFVLRHDPPPTPPVVKGVTGSFLDVDIEEAVSVAREAADGRDVVVLGANIARQCLEAGLLDEVVVHIVPVLLGDGTRLFARAGGGPVELHPLSSVVEGEVTTLHYSARRATPS
ncbi:dihydrofolate reductase family protein [Nocardioides coralli]|uniref:dihydrofolate reductase family protein n=1 Tax=Nocardioides coralli TaxID=2872154 RepID=UPI001CA3E869|nr:dihydrofolate reductase family protein [Nocardioides coralli]QZY29090.1 dihydrofolate reductase family protein [Nocardioides coralli]